MASLTAFAGRRLAELTPVIRAVSLLAICAVFSACAHERSRGEPVRVNACVGCAAFKRPTPHQPATSAEQESKAPFTGSADPETGTNQDRRCDELFELLRTSSRACPQGTVLQTQNAPTYGVFDCALVPTPTTPTCEDVPKDDTKKIEYSWCEAEITDSDGTPIPQRHGPYWEIHSDGHVVWGYFHRGQRSGVWAVFGEGRPELTLYRNGKLVTRCSKENE